MIEQIDEETGEILELAAASITSQEVSLATLPDVAVSLKRLSDALDRREQVRLSTLAAIDLQRAYVQEVHDRRCKPILERIAYLQSLAEQAMAAKGEKKLSVPGVATFRFRKQRAMVDDTEFGGLSQEEQEALSIEHPELIRTAKSYKPDKKAILGHLESGAELRGFMMPNRPDQFEFEVDRTVKLTRGYA